MAFSSVSGLSTGLSLFSVRGREIGVLQEKNYYYSALFQTEQMFHVSKIWEQCGLVVSQVALVAISSVGIFFSAFVAHGHYDWIASRLYLPTELPVFIIHASHLLSEHAGDLVQIAALVGSIAAVFLGHFTYGTTLLATLVYQALYRSGALPEEALFVEKYFPFACGILMLLSATHLSRLIGLAQLLSAPLLSNWADQGLRFICPWIWGPSLSQFDAPLIAKMDLSDSEMLAIINAPRSHFELNPAHCSKSVMDFVPIATNFKMLVDLFDRVEWDKGSALNALVTKLLDDDLFLRRLRSEYPKAVLSVPEWPKRDAPLSKLNEYGDMQDDILFALLELRGLGEKTKKALSLRRNQKEAYREEVLLLKTLYPEFVLGKSDNIEELKEKHPHLFRELDVDQVIRSALRLRIQQNRWECVCDSASKEEPRFSALLAFFEKILRGVDRVSPEPNCIPESYLKNFARKSLETLVHKLQHNFKAAGFQVDLLEARNNLAFLLPEIGRLEGIELEDTLLKLSIDGGEYCAEGLRMVSQNLAEEFQSHAVESSSFTELKKAEIKIRGALERAREEYAKEDYAEIIEMIQVPTELKNNIHTWSLYKQFVTFGLLPFTETERSQMDLYQLGWWEYYSWWRQRAYAKYERNLNKILEEDMTIYTFLREFLKDRHPNVWRCYHRDSKQGFFQLALVALGILRKK